MSIKPEFSMPDLYESSAVSSSDTTTSVGRCQFSSSDFSYDTSDLDSDYGQYDTDTDDDDDDDDHEESLSEVEKEQLFVSQTMMHFLEKTCSQLNLHGSDSKISLGLGDHVDRTLLHTIRRSSDSELVESKMVYAIQTGSATKTCRGMPSNKEPEKAVSPNEHMLSLLEAQGVQPKIVSSKDLQGYFVKGDVASYSIDIVSAVRRDDLQAIRALYESGKNLQCCNQFGETLVHAAARRGMFDILFFLIQEAGVSMRVCCDTGRTPLHDACWTSAPNFESVKFILETCPDFLLIKDNRGFMPLSYIPRDVWQEWKGFLDDNKALLTPREFLA